jgi:hypothetical protein
METALSLLPDLQKKNCLFYYTLLGTDKWRPSAQGHRPVKQNDIIVSGLYMCFQFVSVRSCGWVGDVTLWGGRGGEGFLNELVLCNIAATIMTPALIDILVSEA